MTVPMVAHVIRYEVGMPENAEAFVDFVRAQFDSLQDQLPGLVGSFLLTRREEGEALALFFFPTELEAGQTAPQLEALPAPETGAREIWTGRRAEEVPSAVWEVWQGKQEYRTD